MDRSEATVSAAADKPTRLDDSVSWVAAGRPGRRATDKPGGAVAEKAADEPGNRTETALDLAEINEEMVRLRTLVSVLSFEPLANGVRSRQDALHVLGFPPNSSPDKRVVRAKFRMLATIHHPDARYGSHLRMSQLNQAMDLLQNNA
jgi:hypothetical protein